MSTPSDPFGPRPTSGPQWSPGGPDRSTGGYGPERSSVGYGPPPQAWAPAGPVRPVGVPQTEGKAIIALVCAIASFIVFPLVPAIAALVVASSARERIDASGGWLTGDGLVTASRVIAWCNIVLCALALVVGVLALLAFVSVGSAAVAP